MIAQLADPRDLDALLGRIQFRPRASLESEVAGRFARGDRPTPNPMPVRNILVWLGVMLLLLGAVLYLVQSEFGLAQVRTVDRCCEDFDGGGDRDDGMLVESRHGSDVQRLAIYEDLDGSRSYTAGDPLRFDRSGRPSLHQPLLAGMRTFELCCQDYDGGGPADDAVLIMALPPDRIAMAAIYERLQTAGDRSLR
ncbi:MAG TPA: hypothetical protein VLB12_06775 [Gemmatimonadales bacterium]|nr:hypothetical protein [Gemmatimonadales bacterium]